MINGLAHQLEMPVIGPFPGPCWWVVRFVERRGDIWLAGSANSREDFYPDKLEAL